MTQTITQTRESILYQEIFNYLQNGIYPQEMIKDHKRNLRRKCSEFLLSEGALFYKPKSSVSPRRWVIDSGEQQHILEACHSDKLAGHFGRDKTRQKVASRYYWQRIVQDCDNFVQTCDTCQRNNKVFKKANSELHPIPVTNRVWHRIGIDLVGPLPETSLGHKYLLTCTDYFSKWPEAVPLKNKTAEGIADFLYDMTTRYGVAEIVMSDQGREFVNQVNNCLFELTGTDHRISSAYHPQTNGLDERMNQTIKASLVKYVNERQDDWDTHLKSILFAYRTSVHDSTKHTPFKLMFGREAVLPIELQIKPYPDLEATHDVDSSVQLFEGKIKIMQEIREKVKEKAMRNIAIAQERQKKQYDKKHQSAPFKLGDLVMRRLPRNDSRKGGKLEPSWSGPYTISKCLPKGLYKLSNDTGELQKSYNSALLKPYQTRQNPPTDPSSEPEPPVATESPKPRSIPNQWLPELHLDLNDKAALEKGDMLNDKVIFAAQKVLRDQFPKVQGWQDPVLSQTSFNLVPEESIQIHHTGKTHWVCSTSIGGDIQVFDSLFDSLTKSMEIQLTECYHGKAEHGRLEVQLPVVQHQGGGTDCGLFAIAFAYEAASGNNNIIPELHFEQSKMRNHLIECLENNIFTTFPKKDVPRTRKRKRTNIISIELHCDCLLPESGDMVLCDLCEHWFHFKCMGLKESPKSDWMCLSCRPPV